jgi:DNA-directed RNA polymerase specialized sigma24 family protein
VLRRTLVDTWRHRSRQKRGGGQDEISLENVQLVVGEAEIDRLALKQALRRLASIDPVAARTVELLAIEGFSYDDTARMLRVGRATVSRGWRFGRAFLRHQMTEGFTASED